MARKQVLVQLDDELLEKLDHEAKKAKKSRSALIRGAIRAWLDERWYEEAARLDREGYTKYPEGEHSPFGREWDDAILKATAEYLAEIDSGPWRAAEESPPYEP